MFVPALVFRLLAFLIPREGLRRVLRGGRRLGALFQLHLHCLIIRSHFLKSRLQFGKLLQPLVLSQDQIDYLLFGQQVKLFSAHLSTILPNLAESL
jgi:hypothetical protein